ncbi:IS91 family transposase [Photobacterium damselae]|nr:IS91 family transposase [Photobacterium damselae]
MTFQTLLRDYYDDFCASYSTQINHDIRYAMKAILTCHTEKQGHSRWQCSHCEHQSEYAMSCGHRHCSQCQHQATSDWLAKQQHKLLPVDYFMVTFTLPAELRYLAKKHPKALYQAMFTVTASVIKSFANNDKHLGNRIGFTSVLHTHNRRRDLHPHIHMVITGGGFDDKKRQWKNCKNHYLFNAFALAKVWRARLLAYLTTELKWALPDHITKKWVVDCRHVGQGKPALLYLSTYLYRGVIADKDILYIHHDQVTFRYKDSQTQTMKTRTLPVLQFLWLILQHVLPKGFRRVRDYGLLRGHEKKQLQAIQFMFMLTGQLTLPSTNNTVRIKAQPFCPCCQHVMQLTGIFRPR